MKQKLLHALYTGELHLERQNMLHTPEYQQALTAFKDQYKTIPEEHRVQIDRLLELHTQMLECEVESAFERGFSCGVRLMNEVNSVDLKAEN